MKLREVLGELVALDTTKEVTVLIPDQDPLYFDSSFTQANEITIVAYDDGQIAGVIETDAHNNLITNTTVEIEDEEPEDNDTVVPVRMSEEHRAMWQNPTSVFPMFDFRTGRLLIRAGYYNIEQVRAATDEELLKITMVGPRTVELIREDQGE